MFVKPLKGFKSFASLTSLRLEPGITCIIGPWLDHASRKASGVMAIHNHTAGAFSNELTRARAWFACALVSSIEHESQTLTISSST